MFHCRLMRVNHKALRSVSYETHYLQVAQNFEIFQILLTTRQKMIKFFKLFFDMTLCFFFLKYFLVFLIDSNDSVIYFPL